MKWLASLTAVLALATLTLSGCDSGGDSGGKATTTSQPAGSGTDKVKIGFIVKDPTEPWFQLEWKFAQQAADKDGFELVKIPATDGGTAIAAIDNLSTQDAQGFVICTPDVKLGPAIVSKAKDDNLKVISVDDQFQDAAGKPMTDVHYLGISAYKIGQQVGQALIDEMKKRGWSHDDTAACIVTFNEVDSIAQRTKGEMDALKAAGFPEAKIFQAPEKLNDVPSALDAGNILLVQQPNVKHWLICGGNDNAVIGAVRATEQGQFKAPDVIGIGINGTEAVTEFKKDAVTGLFASVQLSAQQHGYQTADMMYHWIKDGTEPPLDTRTTGVMINRDNYKQVLKDQGIAP